MQLHIPTLVGKKMMMSSSYSFLDWVLSQWAHFTVRIFICVLFEA